MSTLSDPIRSRVLLVLERRHLSVSELCEVLGLPQSTVSRHLKLLSEAGWINARREGTRRMYVLFPDDLEESAASLWSILREQVAELPESREDSRRVVQVMAGRRSRSQEFFDRDAPEWDRVRESLFGDRFGLLALPGLLDPDWVVGDLGCGTGLMAEAVAPFVKQVHAVDDSEAMLVAAEKRIGPRNNIRLYQAALESLPLSDNSLDAAIMILVLHHLPDPDAALAEVRRAVKPGGRILIVDMVPHERAEFEENMGHVWLGFAESDVVRRAREAGFERVRHSLLPMERNAKGPALFAMTGRAAG
ncbi:MAG: metalloregulator ArsR/SmtB family transcription factor [Acidobacteria bacterium]|uniref:Metalloregulator ArsR/SmtB family transcription factor n=1 Tax=Candidatus Polarisedimenticola svalbardensis TaxID=2886004 RepID=A0A8J6XZR1_9BACT|nr:metalloregulator ArsR/SmtB family transcription factor [Candidatus Polarisedimenticola svalbardensis]